MPASGLVVSSDIDIDSLKAKLTQLIHAHREQRAEPNGYNIDTERPQREVELASAQLQQMRQLIKAQLAKREEQAAVLQAQIEGLQQECKAKELQVQEVVAHLDKPEGSDLFHRAQCASSEIKKVLHLTDVNIKLEDHAAKLTTHLHLLQQEVDFCHAQIHQLTESLAAQHAQHDKLMAEQAQHHSAEDTLVRAELQQLHQQYHAKNAQVQQLQMETSQLSKDCDHSQKQAEQLARDFQALQHEHQRLTVTFEGEQQHSRLLQDDVSQLQTYSSALEEDLNKAQAHLLDLLLNGEESLSSKQNDILKAAAKQVIEFKAREAKRSKMPRLLRTFSSLKKERGSYILEDAEKLVSLPPSQPLSPGGAGTPFTPRAMSLSRSVSGITTASSTASMIKIGQDPFGSSGGDVSPLTPAQTEAASGCQRLKAENDILIEKLAQAHQDMAKLSSRLVDAAFSNAHACLPDISAPSSAQLNH
ncbi:MAG: hypothetical protein FRX49_12726 [Trebouxia sp. A1-2]|nr:MAG: hypothetical protein FRX49_12726 [Trebouxia sp. A1-2]